MGEAKRRQKLDPNFGQPFWLSSRFRQFYQITDALIDKVNQCQQQYQRGFVIIFSWEHLEIIPRGEAPVNSYLIALDESYPNDDIIIVNLISTEQTKEEATVAFPWRPHQIHDGFYHPLKHDFCWVDSPQ